MPELFHDLVVFIPDVANQLFQDVLHSYDAQSTAVLIRDDCHVCLGPLQSLEQGAYFDAGRDVHRLRHDGGESAVRYAAVIEILLVNNADYVVYAAVVNRQA